MSENTGRSGIAAHAARRLITFGAIALGALLVGPATSQAAIPDVFGGAVACTEQGDGSRHCGSSSPRSTVETFDGVPIDVNVAFPAAPGSGPDGDYPLVMMFHGYGGGKFGFDRMQDWLDRGYAVFTMTDRGFRESCGSAGSKAADPGGCEDGYVRLIDTRYEVRDAQHLAGMLADEGLIDPMRIGATGGSYGGGMSLALAALRNRMAMPDGELVPWKSPGGRDMEIAAATPFITWSDLAYSLVPNGGTLDFRTDNPYSGRFGVMKQSLTNGLYFSGLTAPGFYVAEGGDPSADLTGWRNRLLAGEPYDGDPIAEDVLTEITSNHSAYYIDDGVAPAPLLLANGFTDDLFPVDEMVRYYHRTLANHPDAKISLFAAEIAGHPRSQSKDDARDALGRRADAWMDHFVKGEGAEPRMGAEAYTQTCPSDAASGGPFRASNWARLAPGEIALKEKGPQTIQPDGGSDAIAAAFNPVTGGGACAQTDGTDQPGTASYRTEPAAGEGLTMLGSALVTARFGFDDPNSQVAARLLDVGPDGMQTLVARGLWRPAAGTDEKQSFQLHPNGWKFEPGHVAKLELLPADSDEGALGGYGRRSDGQQPIEVSDLRLRIPVVERPGAVRGVVGATTSRPLENGDELAAGYQRLVKARPGLAKGKLKRRGNKLVAKVKCPRLYDSCNGGKVVVRRDGKGKRRSFGVAKGGFEHAGGKTRKVKLRLSNRGRRWFRNHSGMRVKVKTTSKERPGAAKERRKARG